MAFLNRLKWVSAGLAVAGAITTAAVWGDSSRYQPARPPVPASQLFPDGIGGRFTKPVVAYEGRGGDVFFALQVKPDLPAAPARPRDIQIVIDHTASQAGAPLEAAHKITREIVALAGESDRIAIWAASTPKATRNLVRNGSLVPTAEARKAFAALDNEYASGAADLKDTVTRVAKEFDLNSARQQVIIYIGDGESSLSPLDEAGRQGLAADLRGKNISFFAVPLGSPMNAQNIHTLVTGTGGAVIRPADEGTDVSTVMVPAIAAKLQKAMGVPVLDTGKATLAGNPVEVYPAKLPPLRADVPTLVVGRFAKGQVPEKLELTVEGKIAGTAVTATVAHAMVSPSIDNYFLNSIVAQWRSSGHGDVPALLRADRTLALAYESTRLARDEFVEQADWALGSKKVDTAKALYQAAINVDPTDPRARAGLKLVDRLNRGEVSLEELRKATLATARGPRVNVDQLVQDDAKKDPPAAKAAEPAPAPADPAALLKQAEAQQRIREQQTTVAVEETLARARDLLRGGDPKSAKDLLIAQRDSLRVIGDIGDAVRTRLLNRVELLVQDVVTTGDAYVRQRAQENEAIQRAQQSRLALDQNEAREERIRERIRSFGVLMNQARYEDAYREALVMENEALNAGYFSPGATFAVARIGQAASNYRDFRELVRLREDRFLLAMMEVEKSHMPYPDEPAVHFPPAKIWRELTARRREFASTDFDRDLTPRQKQRYQFLQQSLMQSIDLRELKNQEFDFGPFLNDIQKLVSARLRRDVPIYINYSTFGPQAQDLKTRKVNLNTLMDAGDNMLRDISFKTILDTLTRQVGASFWITPDYIEIVSAAAAIETKVFKVFAVEDLIIPIPNSVNQLALQQQLQVLGQQFSLGGGNAFGAGGAFGGGNFLGGGGFGGGGGGGLGGQQGAGGGFQGQLGGLLQGGQGLQGFGGGNVGQFGNLGGQFGFQGGRQSVDPATELVVLIQTVVDPGKWDPDVSFLRKAMITGQQGQNVDGGVDNPTEDVERNKMMYNLTTRSLVIYGRSRFHRTSSSKPLRKDDMAAAPGAGGDGRALAGVGGPKRKGGELLTTKPKNPVDAERIWREVVEKGNGVREPGMVIACAEFLAQAKEFKSAAELLKASLRMGVTPERWYQEALAIALEESQGSAEEIERAYLSAIDLEPKNPETYLRVAKSLSKIGNPDVAVRLCQTAAKLEPNVPDAYAHALVYAGNPNATVASDATAFAAGGLLSRDWGSSSEALKATAREQLLETVKKLDAANRQADAQKLKSILASDSRRDLVIELAWEGKNVDLDLRVKEPIGTVCSPLNAFTTAGGTYAGDLSQPTKVEKDVKKEVYSAAEAFNGTYTISVDSVFDTRATKRAQLRIYRNRGTADEQFETVNLDLSREREFKITVEAGRRTELATLPSPVELAKLRPAAGNQSSEVMNKLRALVTGSNSGMAGGFGSVGRPADMAGVQKSLGEVSWSTRLGSERFVGLDIRSETTIRPDGKAEIKAAPVFDYLPKDMRVKMDIIPGSGN